MTVLASILRLAQGIKIRQASYEYDCGQRKDQDCTALLKGLLGVGDAIVLLLQVHDRDQL